MGCRMCPAPCRARPSLRLSICPRDLLRARFDKHSDWFCQVTEDTAMAVVADSHRDFLIPEEVIVTPPTTGQNAHDEPCLFFCALIVSHPVKLVKSSVEKCKKCSKIAKSQKKRHGRFTNCTKCCVIIR